MYFNYKNNFLHGITFHHFHDGKKHLPGQGSINKLPYIPFASSFMVAAKKL